MKILMKEAWKLSDSLSSILVKSVWHYHLTSGAHFIEFQMIADTIFVEQVLAGQIRAWRPCSQLLVAFRASWSHNCYIYWSPPSNSIVTRASILCCGKPTYRCKFSIQLIISISSSSSSALINGYVLLQAVFLIIKFLRCSFWALHPEVVQPSLFTRFPPKVCWSEYLFIYSGSEVSWVFSAFAHEPILGCESDWVKQKIRLWVYGKLHSHSADWLIFFD